MFPWLIWGANTANTINRSALLPGGIMKRKGDGGSAGSFPTRFSVNVKNKSFILITCILLLSGLLCGCSLDFSEQADEGCFSFAYGKKAAFVTEYRWDGTEKGMTVIIPESYHGLPVVSVGGFFGRGLPMPFTLNIWDCFDDVRWAETDEIGTADETVALVFTLVVPEGIDDEDIRLEALEWTQAAVEADGKTVEYRISIDLSR